MGDERTDEELAHLVQNGDSAALAELMERYTAKLVRYGRVFLSSKDAIDDVVEDVFVAAYQNMRDFDATRRFSPWMYRIAHNAFIDAARKQSRGPVRGLDLDRIASHLAYEDPAENEKDREEMHVLVRKHVHALPPPYREIVTLYYFEDLSYQEIVEVLHVPIGTVGIRLARARALLKKMFGQKPYE